MRCSGRACREDAPLRFMAPNRYFGRTVQRQNIELPPIMHIRSLPFERLRAMSSQADERAMNDQIMAVIQARRTKVEIQCRAVISDEVQNGIEQAMKNLAIYRDIKDLIGPGQGIAALAYGVQRSCLLGRIRSAIDAFPLYEVRDGRLVPALPQYV